MFLNQAHIPLQTAVIRSAGYADHDSCAALPGRTMSSSLPPSRHQFAGLQRIPGHCSSNIAVQTTELAGLAVTVTLSRSGCRFPLLQFRSLSCAWLFAAVNVCIHCSAFTAAKSFPLFHQNCMNRDATGASRDGFFLSGSSDLAITTSQTNVS